MGRLMLVVLLSGCIVERLSATEAARLNLVGRLQEKLNSLPSCEAGADVGVLTPRATICTKKHCQEACCNQCGWAATFETKNGQPTPADQPRVQTLLGLPESALDCEIAAWAQTLATQPVSLESGCRVR